MYMYCLYVVQEAMHINYVLFLQYTESNMILLEAQLYMYGVTHKTVEKKDKILELI